MGLKGPPLRKNEVEEVALIGRVLGGDRDAYAELVQAHQAKILRLCASLLSNQTEAEDAAQEIFFKAYRSLASFRTESSFSTWLYRIAVNHCRDLLRTRVRQKAESIEKMLEESGDAAEKMLSFSQDSRLAAEASDLVEQVLRSLSPDERLILTLREVQGLSYQEMARVLQCSLDAVKARLRRAREMLEEKGRHFLEPPRV